MVVLWTQTLILDYFQDYHYLFLFSSMQTDTKRNISIVNISSTLDLQFLRSHDFFYVNYKVNFSSVANDASEMWQSVEVLTLSD